MKKVKFPNLIKTARLKLRFLENSDAPKLFNLINSQREFIGKYLDWVKNVKTLEDEQKYVASRIGHTEQMTGFNWIIETENGEFIGYIGTDPVSEELWSKGESIDWNNGIISFAYFMDQKQTGNGYMTEALNELIKISFAAGFNEVRISTDKENVKSVNVAERCGMTSSDGEDWIIYNKLCN